MKRKDLLGLDGVSREEITSILDTALMMRQVVRSNNKKTAHLQGKSIVTLFYENSTAFMFRNCDRFELTVTVTGNENDCLPMFCLNFLRITAIM